MNQNYDQFTKEFTTIIKGDDLFERLAFICVRIREKRTESVRKMCAIDDKVDRLWINLFCVNAPYSFKLIKIKCFKMVNKQLVKFKQSKQKHNWMFPKHSRIKTGFVIVHFLHMIEL